MRLVPLKARVKVGSDVTFNNTGVETHTFVADDGSWTTESFIAPADGSRRFR